MHPSIILLLLLAGLLGILWIGKMILRLREFKAQLDYINLEIARSSERSLLYWKKKQEAFHGVYRRKARIRTGRRRGQT